VGSFLEPVSRRATEGNSVSDDDGLGYQASWHVSGHALLQRDIAAYFAHCRHLFLQSVCGMSFVYTSTIMDVWSSPHLLRLVSCVIASAFFSIRSHFNFLTSASSLRPFFIFIFYLGHFFSVEQHQYLGLYRVGLRSSLLWRDESWE
jgi:hypothetical protein